VKCNYKKGIPVNETLIKYRDTKHFNEYGNTFIVGECYPDFINYGDLTTLSLNFGGLAIIETLYQPSPTEFLSFMYGELHFALAEDKDSNILFFLSKFGGDYWNSSCINYSLNVKPNELDDIKTEIPMFLFNTSNGELLAIRVISVDKSFITKISDGIRKQLTKPYSIEVFKEKIQRFYKKYPTDYDMLQDAYYTYSPK
jgi:hypothetical protein